MTKAIREANRILLLWRSHGPATPKIDLDVAFKEIVLPSSNGDKALIVRDKFDSFEGLMYRPDSKRRSWIVSVNSKIIYLPRRNFTLAHEIGHFVAHRDLRERFECGFDAINDFDVEPLEKEANEFAAQLLMPPDIVRSFDDRPFTSKSVTELSELLGVSKLAAAMRWVAVSSLPIGFCKSRDGMIINGRASEHGFRKGLFFRSGDELPPQSRSAMMLENLADASIVSEGIWCQWYPAKESAHVTTEGDYIYSFIHLEV
jgi:Zn-dependent peptidase ImmA (M78 family)